MERNFVRNIWLNSLIDCDNSNCVCHTQEQQKKKRFYVGMQVGNNKKKPTKDRYTRRS